MKKTLSIVLLVLLVFLAVSCSPEHQHDYKLVPEKSIEAKCESNGFNYMQCSCGAIQSIPTAALGHDYVEDKDQYIAATCITEGRRVSVCSRCDKQSVVTLAKDINNHPYRYDKSTTAAKEYVGVYGDNKAKITTLPTCANDGVGVFTKCTACGKTGEFTVTIPRADYLDEKGIDSGHAKLNEDKDGIVTITADDVTWETKKEATAFVAGKKNAVCPTCGKEVGEAATELYNQDIPATKNIEGFWKYKTETANDGKDWTEYYLTVSSKNGYDYYDLYYIVVTNGCAAAPKHVTLNTKDNAGSIVWQGAYEETDAGCDGAISLKLTSGGSIYISEFTSDAEIDKTTGKKAYVTGDYAVSLDETTFRKIEEPTTHVHEFKVMNSNRAVSLAGGKKGHYTQCECGLRYVFEEHADDCPTCGYSSTSWFKVTVDAGSYDDTYYLKKGSSVNMPKSSTTSSIKYTNFFGGTFEYKTVSVTGEDNRKSKDPVYYWDEKTTEGLTLTLSNS